MTANNKTVFLTGGASGIGLAIASTLLDQGYAVTIYSRGISAVPDAIRSHPHLLAIEGDITDRVAVEKALSDTIQRFGGIDILINNAAIAQRKLFVDTTPDDWDSIINVNIKGTLTVTHAALSFLKQSRGTIINIASGAGLFGVEDLSIYSFTKAAIINFTQSLAQELSDNNVRVFCITPGSTDTPMFHEAFPDRTPHHSPQDIADVVIQSLTGEIVPDKRLVIDVFNHDR